MGKNKYIETPEKMWEFTPSREYLSIEYCIDKDFEFETPFEMDKDGCYRFLGKTRNYDPSRKANKKRFPDGYIYFLELEGQGIYKVGVSQNPKRRLRDINSYLPFNIKLLAIHYFENVYDIEEEIHSAINGENIKGEWFKMTIEEVRDIMIRLHNRNIIESV